MFKFLKDAISDAADAVDTWNKNEILAKHNKGINELAATIRDHSVTCNRCDGLSVPAQRAENGYRCIKCDRQFSGKKHQTWNNEKAYNEAVGLLGKDHQ